MTKPSIFTSVPTLVTIKEHRAKTALRFGSYLLCFNSLFWLLVDLLIKQTNSLLQSSISLLVCGYIFILYRKGYTKLASYVFFFFTLVLLFFVSITDVKTASVPRTQHIFFIVLAMLPHILFYSEKLYKKQLLSAVCLLLFLWFNFTSYSWHFVPVISDQARLNYALVISTLSGIGMLLVLYVIHADLHIRDQSENELNQAVFQNQLELYYQPQVNDKGKVVGAEALIRWHHPTMGFLMPEHFIPHAEKTGAIVMIGQWVLQQSCKQLALWQKSELTKDLDLSVNISAKEFYDDNFVANVKKIVLSQKINPKKLILEITESLLLEEVKMVVPKMTALQDFGIQFSLDDFGTGYSSLSQLKHLPLAELKIDRGFVKDIFSDTNDATIVDSILNLGQTLGMNTIAEGIENESQWHYLKDSGCKYFQGFLFGKPMDIEQFNVYLSSQVTD